METEQSQEERCLWIIWENRLDGDAEKIVKYRIVYLEERLTPLIGGSLLKALP